MLGRQNKNLILRLLKVNNDPIYHIVVTRKRSKGTSRLDRVGSISPRRKISVLKLDYNKLNKYLIEYNVKITESVAKALNLDDNMIDKLRKVDVRQN